MNDSKRMRGKVESGRYIVAISKMLLFATLTLSNQSAFAQSNERRANPLKQEIPTFREGFEEIGLLRFKANHFYHKLVQITEPGVVSSFWDLNNNTSNKKSYVLNGDIYLPIGMGGYGWKIGDRFIHSLQFIPQVKVRILQNDEVLGDRSLPVRTPSYIPRLIWNFTNADLWNYHQLQWSYYGGLSAFHHSNGQDGNEFNPDGTINTYNGNFSENVAFEVRIGANKAFKSRVRKNTPRKNLKFLGQDYNTPKSIETRKISRSVNSSRLINVPVDYINEVNHRLAYEWHPRKLSTRALEQFDLYGRHRFNYLFSFRKIKKFQSLIFTQEGSSKDEIGEERWEESYRITLRTSLIAGKLQNGNINNLRKASFEERLNLHLTFYWMFKGVNNAAVFARGSYMGSDEYNIYFQDQLWLLRTGLAFGFFNHR